MDVPPPRRDVPPPRPDAPPAPRPPRLLYPSGATVTASASPVFRWIPSPDAPRSRLEVCLDAGCSIVRATLETTEAEARPDLSETRALAPYFWRVSAIGEDGEVTFTTTSWLFARGTRTEETSALLDLVGGVPSADGAFLFEGVVAAARDLHDDLGPLAGALFVASLTAAPDGFIPFYDSEVLSLAEVGPRRGRRVARAGDLDGDGMLDIVVDRDGVLTLLFFGRPSVSLGTTVPIESGGLGDFDGDGDGDVALVYDGTLEVRALGPRASDPLPELLASTAIGAPLFERGDFDGDGLGDALTTLPGAGLQICFGAASPPRTCAAIDGAVLPDDLRMVGDVVGDPSTDFVVRVGDVLELWAGAASRVLDHRVAVVWGGPGRRSVHTIAGLNDLDGDGLGEFAVSVETDDIAAPYLVLPFRGGPDTPTPLPEIVPALPLPHHLVPLRGPQLGLVFDGAGGMLPVVSHTWRDGGWVERISNLPTCPGCRFTTEVAR